MKPRTVSLMKDAEKQIEEDREREEEWRHYEWITYSEDINFWEFTMNRSELMDRLGMLLNLSKWDLFADHLGLDYAEIENCSKYYDTAGPMGMVFTRLQKKKGFADLSLKTVLEILKDLELHSILRDIDWEGAIENARRNTGVQNQELEDIVVTREVCSSKTFSHTIHQAREILVAASKVGEDDPSVPEIRRTKKKKKSSFVVKILMVYASDAKEEALMTVKQLRNPESERGKIGVLLLRDNNYSEIASQLRANSYNCIMKWINQVDFVVPVLSPQFLRQIQNQDSDETAIEEATYNRLVYRLTLDHFADAGSRNYKCRPVYPALYHSEVKSSILVKGNPLFQVRWNCTGVENIEKIANILIADKENGSM